VSERFSAELPLLPFALRPLREVSSAEIRLTGNGTAIGQSEIVKRQSKIAVVRYFGDYEFLEEIARGSLATLHHF